MYTQRNTYRKLDRDTALTKFKPDSFYNARNFRIVSDEELKSGVLTNIDGNSQVFSNLATYTNDEIIGATKVRDKIVIFTSNYAGSSPSGTYGRIWEASVSTASLSQSSFTLKANAKLNFSQQYPIEDIVSFYESETIKKLYWTDTNNNLYYCNLGDPDLLDWTAEQFEIVQDVSLSQPTLDKVVAGSLPVGMVQYAYRLYRLNGPATNFAPASQMLPITEVSEGKDDTRNYGGSEELDDSGNRKNSKKGFRIKIEDVDTDFDRIELVAIFYPTLNGTPEIYSVSVSPISSTMYLTDDGSWDGIQYSLDEFTLINNPLKCKTLASEKNILFAGNVEQTEFDFDFDARAYRWRNTRTPGRITFLYEADTAAFSLNSDVNNKYYYNDQSSPNIWYYYDGSGLLKKIYYSMADLPDTIDAINPSTNIGLDKTQANDQSCKYQTDGSTLGGEGVYVSYEFSLNTILIDSGDGNSKEYYTDSDAEPNYYKGINGLVENRTGNTWIRDEVYRMGVIGFDGKGRHSPVKWIGDIRMPSPKDEVDGDKAGFIFNYSSTSETYAQCIQVDFTITNLPDDVEYVQIVYVPRTEADKTHIFQGLIGWKVNGASGNVFRPRHECTYNNYWSVDNTPEWIYMISPELDFYKNFTQGADDFIQVIGEFLDSTEEDKADDLQQVHYIKTKCYRFNSFISTTPLWRNVLESKLITGPTTHDEYPRPTKEFAGEEYQQIMSWTDGSNIRRGDFNTAAIIKMNDDLYIASSGNKATRGFIANYRRNNFGSQYGGYTYEDRSRNYYIPAGPIVSVNASGTATPKAIWGDAWINYHDHQTASVNQGYSDDNVLYRTLSSIDMFPVETTVNLTFRMDDHYNKIKDIGDEAYLLRETGNAEFTYEDEEYKYDWSDLYQLNTVYLRKPDAKKYFPLPPDYDVDKVYDTQVSASMSKKGGEAIDPWTVFSTNEYIDLESNYGPVNKLMSWNGHLLCWQDDAVGVLSVLERSVVTDTSGKPTVIGTGEVLQRYDYLELENGISTRNSIAKSKNGIYWFDNKRRIFSRFRKGIEDISTVSGMNSYFNSIDRSVGIIDNATAGTQYGFITSYNPKFKEIWFSVKTGLTGGDTLIYNEVLDSFVGFTESEATLQFTIDNRLFSVKNEELYEENIGTKGHFYGSYFDSELTMIINPHGTTVVTFTNYEITSELYDSSGDPVHGTTITSIQTENDYQDTGVITLSSSNARRLIRTWRMDAGRNASDDARLRDHYAKTTLKYTNSSSDQTLVLHDFTTLYAVPAESLSNKNSK